MPFHFPSLQTEVFDSGQITDFGTVTLRGDLRSYAWDGGSDLSGGADAGATAGFFLDSSAGAGQFKSIFAEGIIISSAGSSVDWSHIDNVSITSADIVSLSFDKITAGSNDASLVIGASGSISSANYVAGTSGFIINGDGTLEANDGTFRGTIHASAGSFSGTLTLSGAINFTSGGIIRTASSGRRVEIVATAAGVTTIDYLNASGAVFGRLYSDTSMGNNLSLSSTLGALELRGETTLFLLAGGGSNVTELDNNQLRLGTDGSAATPAQAFASDADTGTYRVGSNVWGVATGGSLRLQVGTAVTIAIPSTTGSGTALMVTDPDSNGNYTILRSSSARKYKSRITYNVDYLADIELWPAKFYRKDDKAWSYGFIAEDLAAEDPLLGVEYDGEVDNYSDRAVLAVLAAKVNRLEAELARLKEAA
ncbi:MAG TPA: hypothetical protein VF377_06870 [Acidimicrobiia bacterium]